MTFQNLRVNSQIYILHKDATPFMEYGTVTNVSQPHAKYPAVPQIGQYPQQMSMVIDVAVNVNGQIAELKGLPVTGEITDTQQNGNIVVSCSREAMNNEVAMMLQKSKDIIASVDYHKGVIAACNKMMNELNPELAEKQRQDQRISEMQNQMSAMAACMKQLMEQLGNSEQSKKLKE